MNPDSHSTPFSTLTPDSMLDALESLGLRPDGRLLALNSYENRVYQVAMEGGAPLIAKFYRAGRWSDEDILEEHEFSLELSERELPVVAPMKIGGSTLHHHGDLRFSLFPRQSGRARSSIPGRYSNGWGVSSAGFTRSERSSHLSHVRKSTSGRSAMSRGISWRTMAFCLPIWRMSISALSIRHSTRLKIASNAPVVW
jgi:hypothetical protein